MDQLAAQIQDTLTHGGPNAAVKVAEAAAQTSQGKQKVLATVALAECQLGAGSFLESLVTASEALELARTQEDKQGEALAFLALTNATLFKDPAEAVDMARKAIDLFQALRDLRGEARALMVIANGETVAEKAKAAAKDASRLFSQANDKPGQAAAVHAFMNAEMASMGPEAGLALTEEAMRVAKDMGSKRAEVAVMNSIASMNFLKGNSYESVKFTMEAFGVCKDLHDTSSFVNTLTNLFTAQFSWENPDEAANYAVQAADVFRALNDSSGLAAMKRMLATAHLKRAQYEEALQEAKEALDIYKGLKDRLGVLSALNTVITVYGNSSPSEPLLMVEVAKDGVAYFKDLGDKRGAAAALHLTAAVHYAVYTKKGEPKEARRAAEAAIAFYRSLQDKEGQAAVLSTIMYANLSKGQPDEALKAVKDLLSFYQATGDKKAEAKALDTLANIHLAKDNARKALKVAQEALSIITSLGDVNAELDVLRTLVSIYFVKRDGDGALTTAQDILARFQKLNDKSGEAHAMILLFRVYQLMRLDDDALKAAYDALSIFRDLDDKRGQLRVTELLCMTLQEKKAYSESLEVAQDALALTRELQLRFSEGCVLFSLAKSNIASDEGLACAREAAQIFKETGHMKEAGMAFQLVANGVLLLRAPARDAIAAAGEGLHLYQEIQDKQGQAVMMHTIANCQLAMREPENAVNSAYEAMSMFEKCGDKYGVTLAKKLLLGAGQTQEEIQERRAEQLAKFDGVETKVSSEIMEERRRQEDEARDLQDIQVLWELAWVPWETQDPKNFGEKHHGGTRRIFVASELQNKGLLKKLIKVRPPKSAPAGGTPYFCNLLNGRLLNKDTLQFGMTASLCTAVVYDVSRLNHHGPLEVIDLVLKLVQAFAPIEERKVSLDMITTSCQNLAYTAGLREPFHATLWGFARAARSENPMNEFRLLDIDAGRREQNMGFICRYLLGAQTTRPAEAICRNGGIMVSRLVGSRSKLNLPMRIELESQY